MAESILIDGTGSPAADDRTILIEGRVIKAVGGPDLRRPSGPRVINAKGKTAMPGLADMHLHLAGGWDGVSSDPLGYQNYMNSFCTPELLLFRIPATFLLSFCSSAKPFTA